jgi:hypothetical protein
MHGINKHPILEVPKVEEVSFLYNGERVVGQKGFTIAAALHQAGYPVHSHSLRNRNAVLNVVSANVAHVRCWSMDRSAVSASPRWTW